MTLTKTNDNGLTPKQNKAIRALLTQSTYGKAAEVAGVSEKTLYRWLELPHFRAALTRAETRAIDECIRHLVRMAMPAAAVIAMILQDNDAPYYVRLRAAVSAVDALLKLKQFNQLEERVTRLEEMVNDRKP